MKTGTTIAGEAASEESVAALPPASVQPHFDPDLLRASLRPLAIDDARLNTAPIQSYLDHYGIDFARSLPGCVHFFGAVDCAPHRIATHVWRPRHPIGTCMVIHGYFDHVGLYKHLIGDLLTRGYAVVTFDLPGHGLSTGDPAHIDSFDEYVAAFCAVRNALSGSMAQPLHIIGQSTGAAIAMEWILRNGFTRASAPFDRVVLLAPLVRPANWPRARLVYHFARFFTKGQPRLFRNNSDDQAFLRFVRNEDPLQARTLPIAWVTAMVSWMRKFQRHAGTDLSPLVIQGERDTTVDWRHNLKVIERLFDPELLCVPDAHHHLVNESAEIRAKVLDAVGKHLKSRAP